MRVYLLFDDPQSSDPLSVGLQFRHVGTGYPGSEGRSPGRARTSREGYSSSAVSLIGEESTEVGVYTLGTFGNYRWAQG